MREYEGLVYDGPWEGRHYRDRRDYFWIARYPYPPIYAFRPEDMSASAAIHVRKALYRWSYPLRAWVFDWNTANLP